MKRLVAAVMFLTRLPLPGNWTIESADVGRSTAFFPLVGAGIGAIQCGVLAGALSLARWMGEHSTHVPTLPVPVLAVILVIVSVLITGALHLDGLADMADGFGGGRTRDDVLRIMRDHAVGAYGAIALMLVLALKIVSIAALIDHNVACRFLVVAPALGRVSVVALGLLPYARATEGGLGGITEHIGFVEVIVSSLTAIGLAFWLTRWRSGIVVLLVTALASFGNAWISRSRIQGITGDTLGANVEICETLVLAAGAFLTS